MEIDDVPKIEGYLNEMEESLRTIRNQVRALNEVVERIATTCRDEPELYDLIRREERYMAQMRGIVDNFPIIRLIRRRLPGLESRIQMREEGQRLEDAHVRKKAVEVQDTVEDLLRKFLK